ncbi:MAG: hypothetical protein ACI976_001625 [Aureispira sp.]|jgi:hypothetical protein
MYNSDLIDKILLKAKEVDEKNKTPSLNYFKEIDSDLEKLQLHVNF